MDDKCTNMTGIANRDNVRTNKEGDEMVTN
jgi:hypothetical protein